jgi:DNA-directed RNA polymerase specialized sigma24 family protein
MTYDDWPSLATMVLDTQRFGNQTEAIERFVADRGEALVGWAESLIERYHIRNVAFSAEDLAQATLLQCWQAVASGGITSIETEEQLCRVVRYKLNQEVLDERAREDARKRGGAGAGQRGQRPAMRQADADLDAIESHTPAPEEQMIAAESIERTLKRLDRHDPSLRAVAVKVLERFTHQEISEQLNHPVWVVHEKVRRIKMILASAAADRG